MKRKTLIILFSVLICLVSIVFFSVGMFAEKQGSEERGFREVLDKNPMDVEARTRLGALYWDLGKKKNAMREFKKTLEINREYAFPYYFLGEDFFLKRKYTEASENYELFMRYMDLSPGNDEGLRESYVAALHKIANRFWVMKEFTSSGKTLEKIIKLDPGDTKAKYNLAIYYYNYKRDRVRAFKEMNAVIESSPGSRMAAKAEFFIDYIRRNPDPRIIGDVSFMDED